MESEPQTHPGRTQAIAISVAMLLALVLIGFGIWALVGAIYAAWGLFRDPASISYFASYLAQTTPLKEQVQLHGEGLAHYAAWVAVVLLLLVLGKLGTWAVGVGARLISLRAGSRD